MMKINEVKALEQSKARKALSAAGGSGIVAMCTGGGKTKIGIDEVIGESLKSSYNYPCLWIVPFEKLRDKTVEAEFHKWVPGFQTPEIICYASMKNVDSKHYSLVVLDEGHHMTEERETFFHRNKVDRIIVLTATPPHEQEKKDIFKRLKLDVVYHLPVDEGVSKGVIAPYRIYKHLVPLYNEIGYASIEREGTIERVSEVDLYGRLTSNIEAIKSSGYNVPKFLYLQRAQFIYNLASKTHYTEKLLKKLDPNNRRIVFCGSIKQAEYLCKHTYHSKTDAKDLDAFLAQEINELGAVNALNEGHNFENIDEAVAAQVNSNPRHFIQRLGRIIRYRPDHLGEIHIIIAKGTVDEQWVSKALKDIDASNVFDYEVQ